MYLSLRLVTAPVTQSGSVSLTMHALSMTHVSALVPVASPQLSPLVCCYLPTLSSPCTLGQQVIAYCPAYCSVLPHVLIVQAWLACMLLSRTAYCLATPYCLIDLIVITYACY